MVGEGLGVIDVEGGGSGEVAVDRAGRGGPEDVVSQIGPGGVDFDGHRAADLTGPDVGGVLEGGLGGGREPGVGHLDGGHGTAVGGRWGREGDMVLGNAHESITPRGLAGGVVVHGRGGESEHLLGGDLDGAQEHGQQQAGRKARHKR